jgi:hypothetical protein
MLLEHLGELSCIAYPALSCIALCCMRHRDQEHCTLEVFGILIINAYE